MQHSLKTTNVEMISTTHIIGVLLTVAVLLAVSWLSARNVKDEKAFIGGGTAGSWMVCGAFLKKEVEKTRN